jgi:FKBP-type peptidyl-prolyl cis-trans isomerase 2
VVTLNYTCRLKGGEIVATTSRAVVEDGSQVKSEIFVPPGRCGPVTRRAVEPPASSGGGSQGFRIHLEKGIAGTLTGMGVGETRRVEVSAEPYGGMINGERYLSLAKVRRRRKETRISTRVYAQTTGREPEIGTEFDYQPGFRAKIVDAGPEDVALRLEAQPGSVVETPHGKGVIRDRGKYYEIHIQADEGRLLRSGDRVGRILKGPDERTFVVDYGHPFGGEVLTCDVTVEGLEKTASHSEREEDQ